jgi:hypothetical protein
MLRFVVDQIPLIPFVEGEINEPLFLKRGWGDLKL